MLINDDNVDFIFIINMATNIYESYSTDLSTLLPSACKNDYEFAGIGNTLNGIGAYVNCHGNNTYGVVRFRM